MAEQKSIFQKRGMFYYKCRRCGENFSGGTNFPHLFSCLDAVIEKGNHHIPGAWLCKETIHLCKDELGLGIADLIGGVFDA